MDVFQDTENEMSIEMFTGYNIVRPPRPKITFHVYEYNLDDPIYESHRKKDNREIFRKIAKGLKVMDCEAKNGFRVLFKYEQKRIVEERKKQAEWVLRHGGFYPEEMNKYREKIKKRVEKIYRPYIKKSEETYFFI